MRLWFRIHSILFDQKCMVWCIFRDVNESQCQLQLCEFHWFEIDNPFKTYRITLFKMQSSMRMWYMTRKPKSTSRELIAWALLIGCQSSHDAQHSSCVLDERCAHNCLSGCTSFVVIGSNLHKFSIKKKKNREPHIREANVKISNFRKSFVNTLWKRWICIHNRASQTMIHAELSTKTETIFNGARYSHRWKVIQDV